MTDGVSRKVERPEAPRGRWTSFVADPPPTGKIARGLHEQADPEHRVRVEHDNHTLLVHIGDVNGHGWTTLALDRATWEWSLAQRGTQREAAEAAHGALYIGQ